MSIKIKEYHLGEVEARFADLVWENEPINSGELVKLCERELNWKKPTTYTVLRKLCTRGIFQNNDAIVTSLISKSEFYSNQSRQFVEDSFGGSLPGFLTAFMGNKKLADRDISKLQQLIDSHKEEK